MDALAEIVSPQTPENEHDRRVRDWCKEWGFTGRLDRPGGRDWLYVVAKRTLAEIVEQPAFRTQWVYTTSLWHPEFPNFAGWDPLEETEDAFRARVETHIDSAKSAARTHGLVPAPEAREIDQQLRRLALFQVKHLEYREIRALEVSKGILIDEGTVGKAVRDIAGVVGVVLRKPHKGRPSKKRDLRIRS